MAKTMKIFLGLGCVVIVSASAWLGRGTPFAQQWPIFEGLRTTASIVFAVVGAWMAIAYPERLKLSIRGNSAPQAPLPKMAALLTPITHSTLILAIVLLVSVGAPLVRNLDVVREHLEFFRGASYALAMSLTLWQVGIVLLTLRPADSVKRADDLAHQTQRRLDAVFGRTSQEAEDVQD